MKIEHTTGHLWNIETDDYNIKDFEIKNDNNDEVIATVCFTSLNPSKSTRGHIDKHNEAYFFMTGEGVMVVDKELHHVDAREILTPPVQDGDVTPRVFVKKGEFHRVLNLSQVRKLNFLSVVPGKVMRGPYEDLHR